MGSSEPQLNITKVNIKKLINFTFKFFIFLLLNYFIFYSVKNHNKLLIYLNCTLKKSYT